ncbi:transmembrane protein, putative (macronuclear) [Tetrahymena thermophila SB210]|uniref:Transmembrane protein, putative n=1 Tax=Tetrahymena thermophila (strain SB210) TaxID=312017 RepID=Q248D8_TETTS|nr:transmembrane protein, putative [Tetrahymena thermophila SB210]EAS04107.1 transmembrane protein, putative [Tetrahymena thermophila SB210]|eukprot:XP_001024352.1 transmembrane protein, putative [Tetrahymena thermophila SB210]
MQEDQQQNTQIPQTHQDVQQTDTNQQPLQQNALALQQLQMIFNPVHQPNGENQPVQIDQVTAEQINKMLQEELKKVNLGGLMQQPSMCQRICSLFFSVFLTVSISIVFGVLLWVFQDQGDKNDYCEHDVLKKWAQATAIMLFINSGVQTIKIIDNIFLKSQFDTKGKLYYLTRPLETLLAIGIFAATIGLTVNNSSDCGQFYKLVLAYYIIYYIFLGIGILALLIFLCMFLKRS